jgi:raffinose/stachyose/melibiose transport system permease protein
MTSSTYRPQEAATVPAVPDRGAGAATRFGRRRGMPNVLGGLGGVLWLLVVAVPIYWIVVTSLKDQADFLSSNPWTPSSAPTLENYRLVLSNGFGQYLFNSVVVTVASVSLTVLSGLMAAHVIVRSADRLVQTVFRIFLLGLAIPVHATIIPVYFIITRLHLYDTLIALVLPSVAFGLPITVLILSNFLRDIPVELFDSMRLDGASEWQLLARLVAPLSRPALVTVSLYNTLQVWNGFLFPLILTQSPSTRVVSLGLWSFQGEFTINVPAVLAAVVLSTLPVLALYLVGRRQMIGGLTAGFSR